AHRRPRPRAHSRLSRARARPRCALGRDRRSAARPRTRASPSLIARRSAHSMEDPSSTPEVVVIGGGPAGSVASTVLADAGHRVVVLERERFPRYHIGESLLSATLPILDAIGATPAIERHGFLRKPGGTFLWGRQAEPWS